MFDFYIKSTKPASWVPFLGLIGLYYLFLLSNGSMALFGVEQLDRTFDSMLLHLLRGDAGVSPEAIGYESFTRNGKTYAYFGIVPALLRLPALVLAADPEEMHLARFSCLIAVTVYAGIILRTVWAAHRTLLPECRHSVLLASVVVSVVFSGAPITMLSAGYVYSEPVLWSAVLVAGFNLIVIRSVLAYRVFTGAELCGLAFLSGLALNTRATAGIDLMVSFGFILVWYSLTRFRGVKQASSWSALIAAGFVMGAGLLLIGWVNEARWGNPLTFADLPRQDILHRHPERLSQLLANGAFNVRRIPIALSYYFAGLPYIFKYHGVVGEFLRTLYDGIEGPPSSPLLTSPLWTLLAVIGVRPAFRRGPVIAATFAGHALAAFILLGAMSLTLRYRMDMAGLIGLPAAFGYIVLSNWLSRQTPKFRGPAFGAVIVMSAVGIVGSHYVLIMSKILNPAVPAEVRCWLQPIAPFVPVHTSDPLPIGCRGD